MAKKTSIKTLFMVTSPRTPEKMIPEIELLHKHFEGKVWNPETQENFMEILRNEDFYFGEGKNNPAFSARDRINRAPKALGFVKLSPSISLTEAGKRLINSRYTNEVFLRQLLKFQLPSPFHKQNTFAADFFIKPYLEIFRLIRYFNSLKFDELWLFGMQLVNYKNFNLIVQKIEKFRIEKAQNKSNYQKFRKKYLFSELKKIYRKEIKEQNYKTRESENNSLEKFLSTKGNNMKDYADACLRYLRATGIITIKYGRSISITKEYLEEVDYFLKTIDRKPCYINNPHKYEEYLYNPQLPFLMTDNFNYLSQKFKEEFGIIVSEDYNILELKELLIDKVLERQQSIINDKIFDIKNYAHYDDIQRVYNTIFKDCDDPSLCLEWNTWRAMTMLDGGNIKPNLKFDDQGEPLSTAQGNMADIICDYGSFDLTVEVTMSKGVKQYEMEGESIMRHLGKHKKSVGKETYCFFIAPEININCITYFWTLYRSPLPIYGGICIILPLQLNVFQKMLEDSRRSSYIPDPSQVEALCKKSKDLALSSKDANVWYNELSEFALNWLNL